MEDDQKWKTTKMKDDQNGRRPKWKMTKMEDNQNERRPKWNATESKEPSMTKMSCISHSKVRIIQYFPSKSGCREDVRCLDNGCFSLYKTKMLKMT